MQAHNNNIEEFLGAPKTVFVVPVYQRNYDWKDENCVQLFNDIIGVVKTGREHFLGTICFKVYNSHERSIIDGQQRLTSITLMLKALYDFDTDEDNRSEINGQYLYNKGRGIDTDFLKFKLHLNKRDDSVYHLLLDSTKDDIEEKLTSSQKNSRIYKNYLIFYEMIESFVAENGVLGDILEALRSLTIIELEIQQENPQEIFESLNSTGLDLTNVDLLRNYFLMQFSHDEQTKLYEDYWSQIEDAIGVDRMEQFFVDFLVFKKRSDSITINGKQRHINERNLNIAFKEYYATLTDESNYDKTSKCFADLKACAELYKNFIFTDDTNLDKETPIRKKLYYLLSINDSSKARSLLLYIFDLHNRGKIDDNMRNIAIDGISSLTFRARICKAQGINRQFAGNVMFRLDKVDDYSKFIDEFWKAITAGRGSFSFPSDSEFMNALTNRELYQVLRSRGTKYLLYTLEAYCPYHKGLAPFDDETLSIEHIMPQTMNEHWKNYLSKETIENYEASLHRLGNLALTNYNGELSNKSFADKKPIYEESKYHYTKHIADYEQWQLAEINDRSHKLAEAALKIWQLPEKYQNIKATPHSRHSLDEDTAQFAHTKPSTLFIGENEYSITNWSNIIPTICKFLENEDKNAFMEIARPDRISAFGIEDDEHKYSDNPNFTHLDGNLYIRYMSSARILNTAKKISIEFDKIAGTDFTSTIQFSLN